MPTRSMPPQMLNLRKIYQSAKDGMSKASDWFDIDAADAPVGAKTSDLNAELAPKKRPAEAGSKRYAAPPVVDDEADDQALRDLEQQAAPQPALTYAGVATLLNKADSPRRCRKASNTMAEFIGIDGNGKFKDELASAAAGGKEPPGGRKSCSTQIVKFNQFGGPNLAEYKTRAVRCRLQLRRQNKKTERPLRPARHQQRR